MTLMNKNCLHKKKLELIKLGECLLLSLSSEYFASLLLKNKDMSTIFSPNNMVLLL